MSVISLAPYTSKATSKAPMSYLDLLPDDVLSIIYTHVIADTTADIETEVALLEANMSIIINRHYAYTNNWTFYMMKMMTPHNNNIHPIHAVYDGFLHINPNINLSRRITAERIRVSIPNVWEMTVHTPENGLAGTRPTTLTWDITKEFHGEDPVTNFTVIDEIIRYALAHDVSLNNDGWKHNCVHHITIINPDDSDDDEEEDNDNDNGYLQRQADINNTDYTAKDDEDVVTVYIDLYKSWDYVGARMFERTHEQSCLANFDDDVDDFD
jgi:hypothetical protein